MRRLYMPTVNHPQPSISGTKTLIFRIKELDKLFGWLGCGEFIVFHGSEMCHVISELLCVLNRLPYVGGKVSSPVVFIDGGNLFDPYLISETAYLLGLNPEETLKNIWVSRAFTSHQMTALITEKLPWILDEEGSKFVLISDIAALYCDTDIGISEAKKTFNRVSLFLWNLVKEKDIMLMATFLSSRSKRKRCLEHYLLGRADVVVGVEVGNPYVKIILEKHPSQPLASIEIFEELGVQPLLEDFMEA